jgi:division/cell wall cluster transcriptional repressor MraZ
VSEIVNRSSDEYISVGVLVDSVFRSLDSKKRLTISAGWRQVMRDPSYVYLIPGMKDGEKCIDLIPSQVFDAINGMLKGLSRKDPKREAVSRFCNTASQVYLDIQGRIRIPGKFLKFAGLKDKLVMTGEGDRIKILAHEGVEGEAEIDFDSFDSACDLIDF